jgi:uncharacterized protein (TIGR03067 family)
MCLLCVLWFLLFSIKLGGMPEDIDLLQGTWFVSTLEVDGQKMNEAMLDAAQIVIKGSRFTSTGMGAVYEGRIELDTSQKPGYLTMHFDAGPEKGNKNLGIYEMKNDKLRICLSTRGNERPTRFATKAGTGFALETLTKTRPRAKAADKTKTAASGPATEFEGEWRMVSGVSNGVPMDESTVQWVRRKTTGDETTIFAGPQTMMKMKFTADSSRSPKTIDYINTGGANKGKNQEGIYDLDGKILKVCMAAPGAKRPKEFESKAGDGRMFTVWERS